MPPVASLEIYCFSGTGNAARIAAGFAAEAAAREISCRICRIEKTAAPPEIDPGALVLIISPIHGFNFPKITLDFIRALPAGKNPVALMCTRAGLRIGRWVTPGLTGVAFFVASFLLRRKGYTIRGQVPFDMPSNWLSIHPALSGRSIRFLYETNSRRVGKHAAKLLEGKPDFAARRDLLQDVLISPVALVYYLAGRFFLAKSFYASSACDGCGLCERQCPVGAIRDSAACRPFWTLRCESCMRCMNLCPRRAIETTHGLWVVLGALSAVVTGLLYSLLAGALHSGLLRFVLFNAVFFGLLLLFYRIQHRLLKNKFVEKWIAFTSLTHYRFWGRYRAGTNRDDATLS